MKANEAPEKIYLVNDDLNIKREWYKTKQVGFGTTEYIRADAFIKIAKEAFCKATCNGHPPRSTCTSLGTCKEYDNFVKFIKGK